MKMILESDEPKEMLSRKKFYIFRKMVKNAKW